MPTPPSAGNPINVGPYKRIVGFNWPAAPTTYIYVNFRTTFGGGDQRYNPSDYFGTWSGVAEEGETPDSNAFFFNTYYTGPWTWDLIGESIATPLKFVTIYDESGLLLDDTEFDPALFSGTVIVFGESPSFPVTISPDGTVLQGSSSNFNTADSPYYIGDGIDYGWKEDQGVPISGLPGSLAYYPYTPTPATFELVGRKSDGPPVGYNMGAYTDTYTYAPWFFGPKDVIGTFGVTGSFTYDGMAGEVIGHTVGGDDPTIDPIDPRFTVVTLVKFPKRVTSA